MKLITIGLAVALLSACAGSRFSYPNARKVEVGMTEAEITQLMGPPYEVISRENEQIWIWSYANGMTGRSQSVSFIMKDGRVIKTPVIPKSFK